MARHDKGNRHGVACLWGTTGVIYNPVLVFERMKDAPVNSRENRALRQSRPFGFASARSRGGLARCRRSAAASVPEALGEASNPVIDRDQSVESLKVPWLR